MKSKVKLAVILVAAYWLITSMGAVAVLLVPFAPLFGIWIAIELDEHRERHNP